MLRSVVRLQSRFSADGCRFGRRQFNVGVASISVR